MKDDPEKRRPDLTLARTKLGWTPKVHLPELVAMMVDADLEQVRREIELERIRSAGSGIWRTPRRS